MRKKVVAVGCGGLVLLGAVGLLGLRVLAHWMNPDEMDFRENVEKQVDPADLQQWAHQMAITHVNDDYAFPIEKLPSSLNRVGKLKPEMALVYHHSDGQPNVVIVWGGGFGHWGLIVGDKDFKMSDGDGKTVSRWIDGVYFFQETD